MRMTQFDNSYRTQAISVIEAVDRYFLHGTQQMFANTGWGSATWPAANRAIYVPVQLERPAVVTEMFVRNGTAAVTGNWDIGIYTEDGTRLVSNGSTAQSGLDTVQSFNITDTYLERGNYYMALVASSTSTSVYRFSAGAGNDWLLWGGLQEASALPLPATATFASNQTIFLPYFGFSGRLL